MNKQRLKKFVKALNHLPVCIKDLEVDMTSELDPASGSLGSHLGLISMLLPYLPPLQVIYNRIYKEDQYNIQTSCQHALAEYLGVGSLETWAQDNPKLWGSPFGECMFEDRITFEDSEGRVPYEIDHQFLIDWWQEVCDRVCA